MARHTLKYARRDNVVRCAGSLLLLFTAVGCASPTNRSFPVSVLAAQRVLGEMRTEPKPLIRPLVVLGGMGDPGLASANLRAEFHKLTGDDRVIGVSFLFCGDFDACRRHVIHAVDRAFPTDDPNFTTEVDVVAMSMGGLVARYAAAPGLTAQLAAVARGVATADEGDVPNQLADASDESAAVGDSVATDAKPAAVGAPGRRLRIARLFTISSPHRGAAWAVLPALSRLHADMRPDSMFLRGLNTAESASDPYEIYPYVRLGDMVVGAPNAAPPGQSPWWVPGEMFQDAHLMAVLDARIIADVARRLRGEEPFTTYPPQPLPGDGDAAPHPVPPPAAEQHAAGTVAPDTAPSGTTFAFR